MTHKLDPDRRRVMSPIGRWFEYLKHFDEVPLPDGRMFTLKGTELLIKEGGKWKLASLSVNELLARLSGLSSAQWQDLLRDCIGGEEADAWREKILNYPLSGRPRSG